jgi:hypothetical protein
MVVIISCDMRPSQFIDLQTTCLFYKDNLLKKGILMLKDLGVVLWKNLLMSCLGFEDGG